MSTFVIVVMGILGALILYDTFVSDFISDKMKQFKGDKERTSSAEKIAQVKLCSEDAKDIEKFITNNATYLSSDMVKQLVSRIESIHADKVLAGDALKVRIDALSKKDMSPDLLEEVAQTKGKKNA